MPMFFDPIYFVFLAPALLLMMWAQWRVHSTFAKADEVGANLSGASAARHILDEAGLHDVGIEESQGFLTDHYDPRDKVLRLSPKVYRHRSAAAVGIAAHEAGHALQDAFQYTPLVIRNAAVPAAMVGGRFAGILAMVGLFLVFAGFKFGAPVFFLGIIGFGVVLFFQLVNLPVEFDASARAKRLVTEMGIVDGAGAAAVDKVLDAAGWTYVAATLQTALTMLYFLFRFAGASRD